jgi:glycosyltransferase involved in cell wall biosynthesis
VNNSSLRILIASDAWRPQVNGVVRTLTTTADMLRDRGHEVVIIEPSRFPNLSFPFYPEVQVAWPSPGRVAAILKQFQPHAIHIATEGPIGLAVSRYCRWNHWPFTTSYHTKFPEYLQTLTGLPAAWSSWYLRWFHARAVRNFVATPSLEHELKTRQFSGPFHRWSRGVDPTQFHPRTKTDTLGPRPILLYAGRVSAEKSLEDFLSLTTPGTKVIVGDGPARSRLQSRYPQAKFLGFRSGEDLARIYSDADLFVFPSRTDTFGIVLIEALASGLPVAAYPVTGPIDMITDPKIGCLHEDLNVAISQALATGQPDECVRVATTYTWPASCEQFLAGLVRISA